MPAEILRASWSLLTHVAEPAARSIVLGCCAAATLGLLRVKNVGARLLVWRGTLIAALAMPLLGLVVLPVHVRVPVASVAKYVAAPSTEPSRSEIVVTHTVAVAPAIRATHARARLARNESSSQASAALKPVQAEVVSTPIENPTPTPTKLEIPWTILAAAIYLAIALVLLGRVWLGMRLANRLERSAEPIEEERARSIAAAVSGAIGLRTTPRLAESEMLSVPVTLGVGEPAILFPVEWREWEESELEAVLAHEISHVARRDALVQRLALIHRAIFWFSPFAWWLDRHLVDLSEQASDEAALESGADRTRYAETLLGFFATIEAAPQRVWWAGVSMAKAGQAEERVDRILAWSGAMSKRLTRSLIVGLIAVAAPVVLLTASVHPTVNNFQEPVVDPEPQQGPVPAQAPVAAPAPRATPSPVANGAPLPAEPSVPGVAPVAPMGPEEPVGATTPMALMAPPAFQELPTPPPMDGNVDEIQQADEAVRQAEAAIVKANRSIAAAKREAENSATEAHLAAVKSAMDAYKAAMRNYRTTLKQYYTRLAEAREIAAVAQGIGGLSAGVYGGIYGGVSGGAQGPMAVYGGTVDGVAQNRIVGRYSGDWGPRYVIVTKGSGEVMMSGTEEDEEHARSLQNKISGDFIWFEHDEKSYTITDPDFIAKAKALFAPQAELERKQDELGRQQDELGKQQDALGKQMDAVKVKIPDITPDLERVRAELDELRRQDGGSQRDLGRLQSELGRLQSEVGHYQSEAGHQQGEIARQQGDLGRKQGELGRQQGELGRQQGELARKASRELRDMFSQAIDKGIAKPE